MASADGAADEVWGEDQFALGAQPRAAVAPTSLQELATAILASQRITLATSHTSTPLDDATPKANITDTAAGLPAHRSNAGTAPGGTVRLDGRLLAGLVKLAQTYTFAISELRAG